MRPLEGFIRRNMNMNRRLKSAKISEGAMMVFWDKTASMTRNETFAYCKELIEGARVPNHTLINNLKGMSKDRMIVAMNNFILKGNGYGV
jgi:hypothetical protein